MAIDLTLRSEKSSVLTVAEMDGNFQKLQDAVNEVNGIKNLKTTVSSIQKVTGFYAGTYIGGGEFYYDPALPQSNHNGGTIISSEALVAWNGTLTGIGTLLNWTGSGLGCFVRIDDGINNASIFGLQHTLSASSHLPLQKAMDVLRSVTVSKGTFRLDSPVYLPSDSSLVGAGNTYGGSVIYTYGNSSAFLFGTAGNPRHTRVKLKGFKILSRSATDREKYLVDAFRQEDAPTEGEAFMDNISELSFGDVDTGIVGHQMNGMRIFGTANDISDIRTLRDEIDPVNPNTTGIGILDSGANRYNNIQCETGSRFILRASVSKITNIHMERSSLVYENSSYTAIEGGNIADGSIILDEKSNCNQLSNISGANIMLNNMGMFNDMDNVQATGIEHGVFSSGLLKKDSWLKPTVISTTWDASNHRVFKLPSAGQYFVAVLLKNRIGTQPSAGTVEVYNLTTASQIIQKTFSLDRYGDTQPARNNSSQTQSFFTVFSGNANDEIVIRKVAGDYAVVSVFMSKGENVNPLGIDGTGWDVAGAPAATESVYVGLQNCTPYLSGGKVAVNVTSGQNFSVSQFYSSKTNAKLYCAIIKGTWGGRLRIRQNGGAHDGSLSESAYAESGNSLSDGKNCAVLYFTREDIGTFPNRSSISFGNFANVVTSASVVIDFCIVFPVE